MIAETKTATPVARPERRTRTLAELIVEQGLTGSQDLNALIGAGSALWNSDADFETFLVQLRESRRTGE